MTFWLVFQYPVTRVHARTHAHTCTRTHTHTHTHTRTCTRAHTRAHTHTHTNTCIYYASLISASLDRMCIKHVQNQKFKAKLKTG